MLQKLTWILASLCTIGLPCFAKQQISAISAAVQAIESCECFFLPPTHWEITDPQTLPPCVKIAFTKKSNKGFCPSINLAIEETSSSLSDYLKAVRAIHELDRHHQWRLLGKVRTNAGLGQLTEIDLPTDFGPVRILQFILIKDNHAYIITAAALKEEIADYYKDFQTAFRSLTLTSDLLNHIPQLERRETLREKQKQLLQAAQEFLPASAENANLLEDPSFLEKYWLPFQKLIIDDFADRGTFWQILLLKNTQEQIFACPRSLPLFSSESSFETEGQNLNSEIQSEN